MIFSGMLCDYADFQMDCFFREQPEDHPGMSSSIEKLEGMAFNAGFYYGYQGIDHRQESILKGLVPVELHEEFCSGLEEGRRDADEEGRGRRLTLMYPATGEMQTLYCPRGHESFRTTAGWIDCASCGAPMTPDAEDAYYRSLCAAGQCM